MAALDKSKLSDYLNNIENWNFYLKGQFDKSISY